MPPPTASCRLVGGTPEPRGFERAGQIGSLTAIDRIEFERTGHIHHRAVLERMPEDQLERHIAGCPDHGVGGIDELEMGQGRSAQAKTGETCQHQRSNSHHVASQECRNAAV